ncbi:MAG TPA: response regulator [Verrucomicrobiae bacterium]|nr:response regulator [Verrucomicrobiae bacterium]
MPDQAVFLLVEDSEDDVLLIRRAFIQARVLNPLAIVKTGEQAIAYLSGYGRYADRGGYPVPSVVLLDLKMPGMDGFQVLEWIRRQETFKDLRVIILTSSDLMRDVTKAYELGADSFLIKPLDFERFVEFSQALSGFWLWSDQVPMGMKEPLEKAEPEERRDPNLSPGRPRF